MVHGNDTDSRAGGVPPPPTLWFCIGNVFVSGKELSLRGAKRRGNLPGERWISGTGDEWYVAVPRPLGFRHRNLAPGDSHVASRIRNDMGLTFPMGRYIYVFVTFRRGQAAALLSRIGHGTGGTGDPSPTVDRRWAKRGRVKTLPYGSVSLHFTIHPGDCHTSVRTGSQ